MEETMRETMKAVGLYKYLPIDQPESLLDLEIPKPKAKGKDLLVRVKAISVNPVDTKVRSPKEAIEEMPKILGWDVAGIVEEVGDEVSLFQVGDEVFYAGAIDRQGGNSEYHLVDERIVGKKPASLDFAEAAALPLTAITAWEALFDRLSLPLDKELNQGKSILIIGAAGGVGSIATQLAKYAGLTVVGTASREETINWVKSNGADYVINHYHPFTSQLSELGLDQIDAILCLNSTDQHWENMADAIKPQGKISSIVETENPVNLRLLFSKSVSFNWEMMFTRSLFQTLDMLKQHHLLQNISTLVDQGIIQTTLTKRIEKINAKNLKEAHQILESGKMMGKIVLENF